jgi:hypothetical protein
MAQWKLQDTQLVADATEAGYDELKGKRLGQRLKGDIIFIDDEGNEHPDIKSPQQAIKAGLLEKQESEEEKERKKRLGKPTLSSDGLIEYTLLLPPEAFSFFNVAKNFGLIKDPEMDFDHWVFECIDRRFIADYKMVVQLSPIGFKEDELEERIRSVIAKVSQEKKE